jgi:hypothetical protein
VQGDPSLRDEQLQDEIDLVGALVLAASQTDAPLSEERIDEILGVPPERKRRRLSRASRTSTDGTG